MKASNKILTRKQEEAYFNLLNDPEVPEIISAEVKEIIVLANQGLIADIAKHYAGRVPSGDLIQYGNEGLIKAIEKFNPSLGYKFSTYAYQWIRRSIVNGIYEDWQEIYLPGWVAKQARELERAKESRQLYEVEKRKLEFLTEHIERSFFESVERCFSEIECRQYGLAFEDEESLPADIGEIFNLEDILPIAEEEIEEQIDFKELCEKIDGILNTIRPREAEVIRLRFGFYGPPATLEEIGNKFGLTKSRVQQIEEKALKKLRHPFRSGKVRDFIRPI
jgi:RNA polymerase primary sigma factor